MRKPVITHQELTDRLEYNPETGEFRWLMLVGRGGRAKAGETAGYINTGNGYRYISVDGKQYPAARLGWFLTTGQWPAHEVDHVNLNRSDDRFENLREATHAQNCCNRPATAQSGFKGVRKHTKSDRWIAEVGHGGKTHYIGCFKTVEDALAARIIAAERLQGEFARAS